MSIYGAMRTSVSGMSAQADRISTISDNVANTSTVGYKRAAPDFASLVVDTGTSAYESGAVDVSVNRRVTQQGLLRPTDVATNIGIKGEGFFVVQSKGSEVALSRGGDFQEDGDGKLINAAGLALLGYPITPGGAPGVARGAAGLVPVVARSIGLIAQPSSSGTVAVNLPSGATPAATLPSANSAASEFSGKTSVVAYGRLGEEITLDLYFAKSGAGTWEVSAYDHANASVTGGFPYGAGALATSTLQFDPTSGAVLNPGSAQLALTPGLGGPIVIDLAQSTQVATGYSVYSANLDGHPPLQQTRVDISESGIVSAVYQNGTRVPIFEIPIASVSGANFMRALGGEAFATTDASGEMTLGSAGEGQRGILRAGMVEQSNVDLSLELTEMIDAQRSYTANSRVFQAGADLMEVLVNLKR